MSCLDQWVDVRVREACGLEPPTERDAPELARVDEEAVATVAGCTICPDVGGCERRAAVLLRAKLELDGAIVKDPRGSGFVVEVPAEALA